MAQRWSVGRQTMRSSFAGPLEVGPFQGSLELLAGAQVSVDEEAKREVEKIEADHAAKDVLIHRSKLVCKIVTEAGWPVLDSYRWYKHEGKPAIQLEWQSESARVWIRIKDPMIRFMPHSALQGGGWHFEKTGAVDCFDEARLREAALPWTNRLQPRISR